MGNVLHTQRGGRHKRVIIQPVGGGRRRNPGNQLVNCRRHRVNIGVRAILAGAGIHFHRRIARANHQHARFLLAVALHRRAEVNQLNFAILGEHQVFRADVAVPRRRAVQLLQGQNRRAEEFQRFGEGQLAAVQLRVRAQIDAGDVLHDDIRRSVFQKAVFDGHNADVVVEFRDLLRLAEEAAAPLQEGFFVLPREHADRVLSLIANDDAGGKIFLNRNRNMQEHIPADVSDAEAALAQRTPHQILPLEDGVGLKMMLLRHKVLLAESARRASLLLRILLAHAPHTPILIVHDTAPPCPPLF